VLLHKVKTNLNSKMPSGECSRNVQTGTPAAPGQQLNAVRRSSADGCFPIASGSGANGARSTSWVFFKVVEQE
jgi:hypothetical protein